jgi:hypothetical protein
MCFNCDNSLIFVSFDDTVFSFSVFFCFLIFKILRRDFVGEGTW